MWYFNVGTVNFAEYIGDYYYDVTQEAIRTDYTSLDSNITFSVLLRYDQVFSFTHYKLCYLLCVIQGLEYIFTNTTCTVSKMTTNTNLNNCGTYVSIEGPYLIAGELGAYMLTIDDIGMNLFTFYFYYY